MQNIILSPIDLEQLTETIAQAIMDRLSDNKVNQSQDVELLTRKEAAALLGISLPTLHKITQSKRLPYHQPGNKIMYDKNELLDYTKRTY